MTDAQKENLKVRFKQAAEELDDESVFSPDQIIKLHNALIIIEWGILEALSDE